MTKKFKTFVCNGLIAYFFILAAMSAQAARPLGTDISGFQPSVNWTTVKNAGIKFVWAKATEGTYYPNSTYPNSIFTSQESGAKSVGIYIGAYHFARPYDHPNITGANSADTEAAWFWSYAGSYVKNGGGYLVPMLDWEDTSATTANGFTKSQMSQWVNEWCLAVSNAAAADGVIGVRPVVYTFASYAAGSGGYPGLDSTVTKWPLWMADYNGLNSQAGAPTHGTTPWSSWDIWQYADTNWSGGDADVYVDTLTNFLQTFAVPYLTANNVIVTPGSSVTFSAQDSSPTPVTFRWYFNGTNIPAATSSNYSIASVQSANAGHYILTASNAYENVPNTVYLTVLTNAAASVPSPANMVNWWPGNKTPADIYGENHATPYGNLSYTNGEVGQAFYFDGSTSYLIPNSAADLSPNWTVCMWVYRQNASGTSASLMGDTTYALKLEQYNTTREVGITQSGVADYLFSPAYTVPVNTWTHLAFVGTSSSVTLYADGALKGSVSVSNFPLPCACIGGDLIGDSRLTDPMLGRLDEIQTFHSALSGAQISAIYNAGGAGLVGAPEFTGVTPTGGANFQLNLRGQTGKNFTLYYSTDLLNWTSLGAISNPTGATSYTGSTTSGAQRFYRASQP